MRFRSFAAVTSAGIFCVGALLGCSDDSDGRSGPGSSDGTGGADGSGTGGADGIGGTGTGGGASGGADGTGGATGGTDGGSGGGATADCSALPLCADFESDSVGSVPAGFTANLNYNSGTNPERVAVTEEKAHSGSRSVKVVGPEGLYGLEYASPGDTFYFRSWLKVEDLSAGNPVIVGVGTSNNEEMRMRLVKKAPNDFHAVAANASSGDGLSPANAGGGLACTDCVALPSDWFCFEMYVDKASQTLKFWVDGEQAVNIENNMPWSGDATWPASMSVLRIGSMALEGGGATVFIDDVAVGPERIGCD